MKKLVFAKDNKKWNLVRLLLIYAVIFLYMYYLCWGQFYSAAGRTTIWWLDGLEHVYSSNVYIHKYVRHLLKNIFIDHTFVVPSWDYSIGYGSGVYMTFDGFHQPVRMLLCALVPFDMLEGMYMVVSIVRLYLIGASFILFAKHKDKSNTSAILGALIYNFSIVTSVCLVHSEFSIPFIMLPLMLIATDQLWVKKFSFAYILVLTTSFFYSYYYSFMICIAIFVYCLQKFLLSGVDQDKSFVAFWKTGFKFLYHSVIAVGMAAVSFLPPVVNMMNTDRMSIERSSSLFYEDDLYKNMFLGLANAFDSGNDWYIGFGAISLVLVFLFFTSPLKKHSFVKVAFLEMTVGLCIPFVGNVMNGLAYSSNRWIFIYLLCLAYIATTVVDEFDELELKRFLKAAGLVLVYCAVSIYIFIIYDHIYEQQVDAIYYMVGILLVAFWLHQIKWKYLRLYRNHVLILICAVSLFISAADFYDPDENTRIRTSVPLNEANEQLKESGAQTLLWDLDPTEGSRYDFAGVFYKRNASWALGNGHSCMDLYMNLYNNNIDRMNKHLAIKSDAFNFSYRGVDERAELDALYGVKYFTVKEGEEFRFPVIYDVPYREGSAYGEDYVINQPSEDVSMAYLFDKALDYASYISLEPEKRQQVLLQAVVIDDADTTLSELDIADDEVGYTQSEDSPIQLNFNYLDFTNESNDYILLDLDEADVKEQEGEWYVYFKNYQNVGNTRDSYTTTIELLDKNGDVCASDVFYSMTPNSHMYGQKHDWLINIESSENCKQVRITAEKLGVYSLDDLKVYFRPKSEIISNIRRLENAGDLRLLDNKMIISTRTDEDKYLFVSEPYSTGWEAFIDGEKTKVHLADDAFMTIELPSGEHEVVFKYHTPWMRKSIVVSLLSLIDCVVIYYYIYRKKDNNEKEVGL